MTSWNLFIDGHPAGLVVATAFEITPDKSLIFRDADGPVAVVHHWDYFVRVPSSSLTQPVETVPAAAPAADPAVAVTPA